MQQERADETPDQTLDRNWAELLQELRVVQTGVQLLTGFLLTLPFQQRFSSLSHGQRTLYLLVVSLSAGSTLLLIAPVAMHRVLFRQHEREVLVAVAHWCALLGAALLVAALVGVNALIFDVVLGGAAVTWVVVAVSAAALLLWLVVPLWIRVRLRPAQ
ncbi:MAG: rane protein [Frankiales bacterium]|nr:rane protein [Frankiales bacterium]